MHPTYKRAESVVEISARGVLGSWRIQREPWTGTTRRQQARLEEKDQEVRIEIELRA